jgi:hypothetical protein
MRVLTYNILDGGIGRESFIILTNLAIKPDIVMVQEVFYYNPQEKIG